MDVWCLSISLIIISFSIFRILYETNDKNFELTVSIIGVHISYDPKDSPVIQRDKNL